MGKSFQDWCVNTLVHILSNRKNYGITTRDKGFRYAVDAIVKHYAGMYHCSDQSVTKEGRTCVNLWWDEMSSNRRELMLKSVIMSKKAREIVHLNPLLRANELKGLLHWEHILPCAKVLDELCSLKEVGIESVQRCFRHNRLVLITKDESRYLDGKAARFENKDLEFVGQHWPDERDAAQKSLGDRPLKGGTALLRIAKLQNNGVVFCTYDDGAELAPESLLSYLNSSRRELGSHQ